jgi:hypothetical protein
MFIVPLKPPIKSTIVRVVYAQDLITNRYPKLLFLSNTFF